MSDTDTATPAQRKESNDDRRRKALLLKATRAHEWRVQVWAQMEKKIQTVNTELAAIDTPPYEPWEPDFEGEGNIEHYATMRITR